MPETITSYNTFSSGTKARAAQVNTNFSNYRGTLLPIHESTVAAANLTYNLGSTEYWWLNAYMRTLNILGATTTHNMTIERDSSVTVGAFDVKIAGTLAHRFGNYNYLGPTTTAAVGQMAASATITSTIAGTSTGQSFEVTDGSCTITTRGRPVMVGVFGSSGITSTISHTGMRYSTADETSGNYGAWELTRDTSSSIILTMRNHTNIAKVPPFAFDFVPAGTYTYKLRAAGITNASSCFTQGVRLFAWEI